MCIYEVLIRRFCCGALKTKGAPPSFPHTKLHYLFSPLSLNASRRNTNQVFFHLVAPSRITTSDIYKSLQVKFLIVWSSLNYFTVHQSTVTNSMHKFQFTYIPHLQHFQSRVHLESSQASVVGLFVFENSQLVETVGCFRAGSPSWILDRILNATLPNNLFLWVTLGLHQHSVLTSFNNTRNTRTTHLLGRQVKHVWLIGR